MWFAAAFWLQPPQSQRVLLRLLMVTRIHCLNQRPLVTAPANNAQQAPLGKIPDFRPTCRALLAVLAFEGPHPQSGITELLPLFCKQNGLELLTPPLGL